jgi:hypothetical protein
MHRLRVFFVATILLSLVFQIPTTHAFDLRKLLKKIKHNHLDLMVMNSKGKLIDKASGVAVSRNRVVSCAHIIFDDEKTRILQALQPDKKLKDAPLIEEPRIFTQDLSIGFATIIDISQENDLLLLEYPLAHFTPEINFPGNVEDGDRVHAYTNSFGMESIYVEHTVSKVGADYIVIAPSINPGSSGSAFYNDHFELVGIGLMRTTAKSSGLGALAAYPVVRAFILRNNLKKPAP